MDLSLVMFKADGTRRDFPVKKDRIVIGRKPTCDLRIPLSSVSRQHCAIELDGDTAVVRDLGSSNGTFHNSERIQEQKLAAGDSVMVGPVVFTVVIDGEPAEIEPVRSLIEDRAGGTSGGSGVTAAHTSQPSAADSDVGEAVNTELDGDAEVEAELEPADESALAMPTDDDDLDLGAEMGEDDPLAALERLAEAEGETGSGNDSPALDDMFDLEEGAEDEDDPLAALGEAAGGQPGGDTGEVEVLLDDDEDEEEDENENDDDQRSRRRR